jgi:hypothetical protein
MLEKIKNYYFKFIGRRYVISIIIIICSVASFIYGDAIRSYLLNIKIHWLLFIIYSIMALALMEIAFDSHWIKNQTNAIRYILNIITIIYCAPLLIIGITLVFGSFIMVPISMILSILLKVKYAVELLCYLLLKLIHY